MCELKITAETRVLDIGGTSEFWDLGWGSRFRLPRLVLLNTPRAREEVGGAIQWVAGDGCSLPFRDGAFDVVFSNSVIEHVGDRASQERFAQEVMRVGRMFWIQTPNRWFPVEQHLLTPLVHWLPKRWQRAIVPRANLWSVLARVTPDRRRFYIEHYLHDVRLLNARELGVLFPGARIIHERFLGMTKSLIAASRAKLPQFGSSPAPAPNTTRDAPRP